MLGRGDYTLSVILPRVQRFWEVTRVRKGYSSQLYCVVMARKLENMEEDRQRTLLPLPWP